LQALSLWSLAVIDALRAEGHPIRAGAAGENVTLTGIDWTTIRPGVRLTIGPAVVEISAFATPCAKNAQWFADGEFRRIDHERNPGWSRAYAWVLRGGELHAGDEVVVEP
jgi:MOSC domain-containing protein YiiM